MDVHAAAPSFIIATYQALPPWSGTKIVGVVLTIAETARTVWEVATKVVVVVVVLDRVSVEQRV